MRVFCEILKAGGGNAGSVYPEILRFVILGYLEALERVSCTVELGLQISMPFNFT